MLQSEMRARDAGGELLESLRAWGAAAEPLVPLAEEQLEAILSPDGHRLLDAILHEKEQAYRRLQDCSVRARAVEEKLAAIPGGTGRRSVGVEIDRLREGIHETLVDLDGIETRSRELLRDRMKSIRSGLEHLRRSRSVIHIYGNYGGHGAGKPRFLDQRR